MSELIPTTKDRCLRLLTYSKMQKYEPMGCRRWHTKCFGFCWYCTRAAIKNSLPW